MLRLSAMIVLVLAAGASAAFGDASQTPEHRHHVPPKAEAPPAPPALPDPVTWMTKAVDDILTGVIPSDANKPTRGQ